MARCSKCGETRVSHNWRRVDGKCRKVCTTCGREMAQLHRFDANGVCAVCGERKPSLYNLVLSSPIELRELKLAVATISKEEGQEQENAELLARIDTNQMYTPEELETLYRCAKVLLDRYFADPVAGSRPERIEAIKALMHVTATIPQLKLGLIT